jgi:hypothetical protein
MLKNYNFLEKIEQLLNPEMSEGKNASIEGFGN